MLNFRPGRIPFNSVASSNSNKNFPANKNINNNNKNINNINKNFSNNNKNFNNNNNNIKNFNKNLKNISQINYPNLKGRVKFPSIIKFSIKFNTKFPYYIVIVKFPYYIKFPSINYIKFINNVIGVRQLVSL